MAKGAHNSAFDTADRRVIKRGIRAALSSKGERMISRSRAEVPSEHMLVGLVSQCAATVQNTV